MSDRLSPTYPHTWMLAIRLSGGRASNTRCTQGVLYIAMNNGEKWWAAIWDFTCLRVLHGEAFRWCAGTTDSPHVKSA